jgi:hypothetical protein
MINNSVTSRKFISSGAITLSALAAIGFQSFGLASFKNDVLRVGMISP